VTSLKEQLHYWRLPFREPVPREPKKLAQAHQQIIAQFSEVPVRIPSRQDLDEIWRMLQDVAQRKRSLQDFSRLELRLAAWVIFENWNGQHPLALHESLLRAYLERVTQEAIPDVIIALCQAFLKAYPRGTSIFDPVRSRVRTLLAGSTQRRCRRLVEADERFGILAADAPEKLITELLDSTASIDKHLAAATLTGHLSRQGLVEAAFERGLALCEQRLGLADFGLERLERLLAFALVPNAAGNELRFKQPALKVGLAHALLLPFTRRTLPDPFRKQIKEFVLAYFGDPRLGAGGWVGVSSEARAVVQSWLVKETLDDFFLLLEYVARTDETARRHWKYRKAFWTAYLRAGHIRDAWVVLHPKIVPEASRMLGGDSNRYGRLKRGPGIQADHAALLLRVGNLVITEWNHMGKYRVWVDEGGPDRYIPSPYRREYSREDLILGADHEGVHHGAENGRWQATLADLIRRNTGIRMWHRMLMP